MTCGFLLEISFITQRFLGHQWRFSLIFSGLGGQVLKYYFNPVLCRHDKAFTQRNSPPEDKGAILEK